MITKGRCFCRNTDLQSSLTLANSCSSEFTLKTMAYVSILVPFVIAYIFYAWRSIDRHNITEKEMDEGGHSYYYNHLYISLLSVY